MDKEEQRYFDGKFDQVHKRITDSKEAQTAELHLVTNDQNQKIAALKESIETHKVESSTHPQAAAIVAKEIARKALEDHQDDSWVHNPVKTWSLLGTIAAVFGAIGAFIMWIVKHFKA